MHLWRHKARLAFRICHCHPALRRSCEPPLPLSLCAQAWGAAFFVVYQAIAQFFILNLFCSIILDKYVDLTENKGRGIMLTENQKKWVESNVYLLRMDVPSKKPIEPKHPLRKQLFKLVTVSVGRRERLMAIQREGSTCNACWLHAHWLV